ncbi:MAG: ChaN family lipoprotein [Pyrinomonadaceae bacterium]
MKHIFRLCILALALALLPLAASAQTVPPSAAASYRIYDATGQPATLEQVLNAAVDSEVVFVGEIHNDPGAHQIELQLLQATFARLAPSANARPLVLSMEMFERDVQTVLDEYLAGLIQERHFLAASRPWNNYQTDYRPLVEFANAHKLPVVAANAPERYVNRVGRLGRDALKVLSPPALAWLAPLPYGAPSTAYAAKFKEVMTGGMQGPGAHGNPFLLDAQALRDATMAHSLAMQLHKQKHALILHVNGSFHSASRLGTPEQLRALRPQTRMLVITIVPAEANEQPDVKQLAGQGDFVFVTAAAATGRF